MRVVGQEAVWLDGGGGDDDDAAAVAAVTPVGLKITVSVLECS